MRRKPVRWQEVVPQTLNDLAATAQAKQVTLHNELPPSLPAVVGDERALHMLLSNLVANAIRYNRAHGQVSIGATSDEKTVSLSVADTGIGIAPEHQAHVFEEFYRVKGGNASHTDGTGMGLPICKRIAEELGGRVTLLSEPDQGSTFTVVLPREDTNPSATGLSASGEPNKNFSVDST